MRTFTAGGIYSTIRHFPDCFHAPISRVSTEDYRFFVLYNYMYTYSLAGHALFIPIFYLLGDRQVFINNLACVFLDALWLLLNFRGHIRLASILWIFEIALHASYCVIAFGQGLGFEYYLLALTASAIYLRMPLPLRALIVAVLIFMLTGLLYFTRHHAALPPIPFMKENMLHMSNAIACFAGVAYITNFYSTIVRRIEEKLRYQAVHDILTGLLNRGVIIDRLGEEISKTGRFGIPLSIAMIDIDHFKAINDTRGHLTGDAVLKHIAGRIDEGLRSYDLVGRYGGEEFLAILPGCTPDCALAIFERLRHSMVEDPVTLEGDPITVTLSFGVTTLDGGASSAGDRMIAAADSALYCAKRNGRNRVEFVPLGDSPSMA